MRHTILTIHPTVCLTTSSACVPQLSGMPALPPVPVQTALLVAVADAVPQLIATNITASQWPLAVPRQTPCSSLPRAMRLAPTPRRQAPDYKDSKNL